MQALQSGTTTCRPPNFVAWVEIPDSDRHHGGKVCCLLSSLLAHFFFFFSSSFHFPPFLTTNIAKFQCNPEPKRLRFASHKTVNPCIYNPVGLLDKEIYFLENQALSFFTLSKLRATGIRHIAVLKLTYQKYYQ